MLPTGASVFYKHILYDLMIRPSMVIYLRNDIKTKLAFHGSAAV